MSTRRNRSEACWRWSALILGAVVVGLGCNPATLYFLMPWKEDNVACKMPLTTTNKKEPVVVILASFSNPVESRPEFQAVDRDLSEKLGQALTKRYVENKEKITIIPNYKVKAYLNKEIDGNLMSKYDIGKHFNADYVINLEINSMKFYEGSYRQLFRGNSEIMISVIGISKEPGEGPVYEEVYRTEYPARGPIDAGDSSVLHFRTLFINRLARDLSRFFAPYPPDERYDMD